MSRRELTLNDLQGWEYQELVLMVGSKKALATYLGLDARAVGDLWKGFGLQTPLEWMRCRDSQWVLRQLAIRGSVKVMAKHYGMSSSALRAIVVKIAEVQLGKGLEPTEWELVKALDRYKSVRFAARMLRFDFPALTESDVRRLAKKYKLDLSTMLDWTFSNYANAKGRRAELEFARIRGENILEDCNMTRGSQAEYDFVDKEYGRVNVKSSRLYRMKAKTRSNDPYYGKFSTSGIGKADTVVCMLYDFIGRDLLGMRYLKPAEIKGKTFTLSAKEIPSVVR